MDSTKVNRAGPRCTPSPSAEKLPGLGRASISHRRRRRRRLRRSGDPSPLPPSVRRGGSGTLTMTHVDLLSSPPRTRCLATVRLDDLAPFDGASTRAYATAVQAIAESLTRHGAAALELPAPDAAIVRCALESARAFFRARGPGLYVYRAGRLVYLISSPSMGYPSYSVHHCNGISSCRFHHP
jgi:hypothetical protein